MKKTGLILFLSIVLFNAGIFGQNATDIHPMGRIPGTEAVIPGKFNQVPDYIRFKSGSEIPFSDFIEWCSKQFNLPTTFGLKLLSKDDDQIGYTHYRYQQTINRYPVMGTMYIVHVKDGKVKSMNGQLLQTLGAGAKPNIDEQTALASAMKEVKAATYQWQGAGVEGKRFFPKGELVYVSENGILTKPLHLAYQFDIYATKPLSRNFVYVDAVTGNIVYKANRLHTTDVNATAITRFSGSRTIVTDSFAGGYRLQEAARGTGNGMQTYNMLTGTDYALAVDFINATTTWNNVNTALDQYATDAHFASEMTYDFYKTNFNRNSLDNQGMALIAYVHYDQLMQNAFWDGQEMNYGDGGGGEKPFTSLEIGGHEITHGLTQFTANLNYQDESGALNESFSDCMGTAIRQFVNQAGTVDYQIGDNIGPAFRSMSNPKIYQQPTTYHGTYWYTGGQDNGGVHTNSGVQNYWYYLVAHGGNGTNDNGNTYQITGIGIDKAAAITYRNLTVYLTTTSQYADARTYSIQAATDLYGACSPEVATVTNAWYAVGVGSAYVANAVAAFSVSATTSCSSPTSISFANSSINATNYTWDFGDGTTSNASNPSHTFNQYGSFTVKLVASSTGCGTDSITKTSLITITDVSPTVADATICAGQTAVLNATSGGNTSWYSSANSTTPIFTGSSFTTPSLSAPVTYYVSTIIPGPTNTAGPIHDTIGTGGIFTNTNAHSVIFNCTKAQVLTSVDVYAQGAGNRTINLLDANDSVLITTTVNIPDGMSTVSLNFNLPVKSDMKLESDGNVNLYRNQSGAVYPYYSSDSTVVLTNSDAGTAGYYYFFYNWQLQSAPCTSLPKPVQVNVLNSSAATFVASGTSDTINFSVAGGANSYTWNFGDGQSATTSATSHVYEPGTYKVLLYISNGTCSDTLSKTIIVTSTGVGINELLTTEKVNVYPIPASGQLFVDVTLIEAAGAWDISAHDILGRIVVKQRRELPEGSSTLALDISSLATGVYLLNLHNGATNLTKRFVKQ